jgi:hypothetical protein
VLWPLRPFTRPIALRSDVSGTKTLNFDAHSVTPCAHPCSPLPIVAARSDNSRHISSVSFASNGSPQLPQILLAGVAESGEGLARHNDCVRESGKGRAPRLWILARQRIVHSCLQNSILERGLSRAAIPVVSHSRLAIVSIWRIAWKLSHDLYRGLHEGLALLLGSTLLGYSPRLVPAFCVLWSLWLFFRITQFRQHWLQSGARIGFCHSSRVCR